MYLIIFDAKPVTAFAVVLQHDVRRSLVKDKDIFLAVYLTLNDHGVEDRQSFESACNCKITSWSVKY